MRRLAIALVHHPVLDAGGAIVTSALTNLDVHDLARSARTYGCSDYFVVHPIEAQRELATRIVAHWTTGSSAKRIPDRKDALAIVRAVPRLEDAISALGDDDGTVPRNTVTTWVTAARELEGATTFEAARQKLDEPGGPVLVVFGTGWGLAADVVARADAILEPIRGVGPWNHLSVRAACAIALDRLRGQGSGARRTVPSP